MFYLSRKEKIIVLALLLAFLIGWFYREVMQQKRAQAAETTLQPQLKISNEKSAFP
ncbi:MAG: hypothetical protein ACK5LK_08545 [Chthoniobacterales bacterium]